MLITPKLLNRSVLKNVSLLVLLLKICIVFGQKKVVVIDPGHGGIDSGAIGLNGTYEKDVVLNVAKEILNLNKYLFENELDIYLTRYTDTLISLSDRSRLTKSLKADVFVSLHCNASQTNSRGMEVYVHHSESLFSSTSFAFGISILNRSIQKLGFEKGGVKLANFHVLRQTAGSMPSVLVELGFLSNKDESNYHQKPESQRALALMLLESLIKYLENYERVGI